MMRRNRIAWRAAVEEAMFNPLGTVAQRTARPYLLAHPEREIAAAGTHIGVAYCAACDITFKATAHSISHRIADAYDFVRRHNAELHPRRARKANA